MKAFPHDTNVTMAESRGMDLRQWYAGMALQGILSSMSSAVIHQSIMKTAKSKNMSELDVISKSAFEYADSMIEEGK